MRALENLEICAPLQSLQNTWELTAGCCWCGSCDAGERLLDMYSSEKHWTADLGVAPDRDHIQRHLQSWIQTRM